jgi:hypothetical protein
MTTQVQRKQIVCTKCGSVDDYRTELKANNLTAYCNGCDSFITNIPYQPATFYFGKYKGVPIDTIEDLSYLQWAIKNIQKLSAHLREAIERRISSLQMTHR